MALTMTRTRTQTALTKLAGMVANIHGELAFVEAALVQMPKHKDVLIAPIGACWTSGMRSMRRYCSSTPLWSQRPLAAWLGGCGRMGASQPEERCCATSPPKRNCHVTRAALLAPLPGFYYALKLLRIIYLWLGKLPLLLSAKRSMCRLTVDTYNLRNDLG